MFWIPFFRVTMELGQLVQAPCSFSLTMPSSNPRYRTSPPSSCTVGLQGERIHIRETATNHRNRRPESIFRTHYLIRVSSSSLIIATTSSSSSDGAGKEQKLLSFAFEKKINQTKHLILQVEQTEIQTCVCAWLAAFIHNWKPRSIEVHDSRINVRFNYFPFHCFIGLSKGIEKEKPSYLRQGCCIVLQ